MRINPWKLFIFGIISYLCANDLPKPVKMIVNKIQNQFNKLITAIKKYLKNLFK